MNKENLLKGAAFLEADAENPQGFKFDLNNWAILTDKTPTMDCKTAACAMGAFAISGIFPGLTYHITESFSHPDVDTIIPDYIDPNDPDKEVWSGYYAAAKLFEISNHEAWRLFHPDYYEHYERKGRDGELAVAARMREWAGKQ